MFNKLPLKNFLHQANDKDNVKVTHHAVIRQSHLMIITVKPRNNGCQGTKRFFLGGFQLLPISMYEKWNNIPPYTQTETNRRGPCKPSLTSML